MTKNIIHVGIDVDDNSFHGAAFFKETGEIIEFKTKPTFKGLQNKLDELKERFPESELKICYEATYIGFTLQRDLTNEGFDCVIVAPSSIPRRHGNQVKTDRVDATKLAEFYASNILTFVTVPEKELEEDRDLMRSRQFILHQLSEMRTHIQSLLRRSGIHYKVETQAKSHWTRQHMCYLERKANELTGSIQMNLRLLLQQVKWLKYTLEEYDKKADELAESARYEKQVKSLICYNGIKNIFAMTMITEIGNVKRFAHPRQLVSWMGLDVREYSSGGKHNRFGITKHGNRYLRTAFVESNQRSCRTKKVHERLKSRRKGVDPRLIHIADRCQARITKKGSRLIHAGKHVNKVKVACAREMVGFVWESLNAVS